MRFALFLLFALCATASVALAQQDPWQRVDARVVSVQGNVAVLDVGENDRVEVGDRLLLFPTTGPTIEARIESVTKETSRIRVTDGSPLPIGTTVEVFVPRARLTTPESGDRDPREHPPWKAPIDEWDTEVPLLAPIRPLKPEERDVQLTGRVHLQLDATRDSERDGEHYLARTGADLRWENLFGRGGTLDVDVEAFAREADYPDGDGDDSTRLRIDRLSYRVGGLRGDQNRFQVGRFLQHEFPEFGLLDGVEVSHQLENGDRVGGSVGLLPEPFADLSTGDDIGASIHYRHVRGANEELRLGAAFQKTWHEGSADRDLFLFTADYVPNADLMIFGTAFVDWYTGGDQIKGSGPELTELSINARLNTSDRSGLGFDVHHFRFPELERDEFTALPPLELDRNHVSRIGLSGWHEASETVRLDGRVQGWSDEDDSGGGGELGVRVQDALFDRSSLGGSLFIDAGSFNTVTGLRLRGHRVTDRGTWRAFYELASYDQEDFTGLEQTELQHRLRASYDTSLFRDFSLSVSVEHRFGDEQNATALGLFLQRRF